MIRGVEQQQTQVPDGWKNINPIVSRRRILGLGGGTVTALFLASCGEAERDPTPTTKFKALSTNPTVDSYSGFRARYKKKGEVSLEQQPIRETFLANGKEIVLDSDKQTYIFLQYKNLGDKKNPRIVPALNIDGSDNDNVYILQTTPDPDGNIDTDFIEIDTGSGNKLQERYVKVTQIPETNSFKVTELKAK